MKNTLKYLSFVFLFVFSINVFAQPYTLDEEIKPTKLELRDLEDIEDAKGLFVSQVLEKGQEEFFYVTNLDIFQFIDLYIFSLNENEDLLIEIAKNTWNKIEDSYELKKAKEDFINISLRTYNDFGIKVTNLSNAPIHYSLAIYATPPVKGYLKSPFVKATKANLKNSFDENPSNAELNKSENSNPSGTPLYIYIIIGLLVLLVFILLYKKRSSGSKNMGSLLILIGIVLQPFSVTAQSSSRPSMPQISALDFLFKKDKKYRDKFVNDLFENNNPTLSRLNDYREGFNRINKVASDIKGKIDKATATYGAAKNYYDSYTNLGDCLGSGTPPGQPRTPSFCVDENSDCATCFVSARREFNRLRHQIEKLQTIYNCTKSYSDAAIAFGDNVSSYHGVVGLVWQSERKGILKSMSSLNKSYDKKRIELLGKLNATLIELAACEEEHGIPDWYDRFGVLFFDFMEMKYHR